MKIGIVGSGNMGSALGTLWSAKGHQVKFSYSRNEDKLTALSKENKNTSKGTVEEAILFGDVVMLAVPYTSLEDILLNKELFKEKIAITCVSGLQPDFTGKQSGSIQTILSPPAWPGKPQQIIDKAWLYALHRQPYFE